MRREPRLEPRILGGEMGEDGGILDLRIAGIAQPVIRVIADDAVVGRGVGNAGGDGRLGHAVPYRVVPDRHRACRFHAALQHWQF